jgi:hypothetical protein
VFAVRATAARRIALARSLAELKVVVAGSIWAGQPARDRPPAADSPRFGLLVGMLEGKLKKLALPIDLFKVSEHGMENIAGNWIDLDHFADLSAFQTEGMLLYSSSESDAEKAYQHLKGASDKFVVYRRRDVPKGLHYDENEREGDPVAVATGPYVIRAHATNPADTVTRNKGGHGYDPQQFKTMRGIFYAIGPGHTAERDGPRV